MGLPSATSFAPGLGITHHPGVAMVWITRSYRLFRVPVEAVTEAGAGPSSARPHRQTSS
jgi:hypothetical protein